MVIFGHNLGNSLGFFLLLNTERGYKFNFASYRDVTYSNCKYHKIKNILSVIFLEEKDWACVLGHG